MALSAGNYPSSTNNNAPGLHCRKPAQDPQPMITIMKSLKMACREKAVDTGHGDLGAAEKVVCADDAFVMFAVGKHNTYMLWSGLSDPRGNVLQSDLAFVQ